MMIRRIKQTCLGVLLIVAALLTACSSEDKGQPEAVSREQPKTWKLCVQANKIDSTTTRGLYLDGSVLKSKWGDPSTSTGQTVEVWRGDTHLGNLTASASSNGSTVITGELTGTFTKDETLTLYSPSKTRDYSGQTGIIESISSKDYMTANITVTAVDGSSGLLATSTASFDRLQSFTKFTFSEAVHQVVISAEGMDDITVTTASGNTTEFYVALPLEGAKLYTFVGTTDAGVAYYGQKNGTLTHGKYYTLTLPLHTFNSGDFTVAAGTKVKFSQGNLQATWNGSTWTWAFAKNQWDFIGDAAKTSVANGNGNVSISGNGTVNTDNVTVDLFGWVGASNTTWSGTAGSGTTGEAAMHGITNSTAVNDVSGYGNKPGNDGETLKSDWGNVTITNGGGYTWRSLTSAEWQWLLGPSSSPTPGTNCRTSGIVNGTTNARWTHAEINTDGTSVYGMILFPDGLTITPAEASSYATTWGTINTASAWGTKCTTAQWGKLAAKGCVFLPAAGSRNGTKVENAGSYGYYWFSSAVPVKIGPNVYAYRIVFYSDVYLPVNYCPRNYGHSVRLVRVP